MPTLAEYVANPPKLVGPDYNIYYYTESIYKIVKFKKPRDLVKSLSPKKLEKSVSDKKFDSSLSRARRNVLELALCNDWKYFCTFTLDKDKYDRYNLKKWNEDFSQWIRDQRKKYRKKGLDLKIPFLLVPELHHDGAWHMHGLLGDISPLTIPFFCERQQGLYVPDKLVNGGFFDWPEYREKFGFCSLGLIQDKVATAFYVSKYITKELQEFNDCLGAHVYYCSHGLSRAVLHGSIYGACEPLDPFLVNDYEWVKTGMTHTSDNLAWHFAMEYMDSSDIEPMEVFSYNHLAEEDLRRYEEFFEGVQEMLEGFN